MEYDPDKEAAAARSTSCRGYSAHGVRILAAGAAVSSAGRHTCCSCTVQRRAAAARLLVASVSSAAGPLPLANNTCFCNHAFCRAPSSRQHPRHNLTVSPSSSSSPCPPRLPRTPSPASPGPEHPPVSRGGDSIRGPLTTDHSPDTVSPDWCRAVSGAVFPAAVQCGQTDQDRACTPNNLDRASRDLKM